MSEEDEALSLSEMPAVKNKIIKRKLSYDKLLKNKYINYTEEELIQMNDTRKDEILEIEEKNKKLKKELTKTIEKLNTLITSNSEILFVDQKKNMAEIENLEKIFYLRKHDHSLSMKYNTTFKQQYNALKIKSKNLADNEKLSQKLLSDKNNLEELKTENIELNKKIQEQEISNVKQTKELENANFIQKTENNLQNYANILSNLSFTRFEYQDKIENKRKSVEQLKEQFKSLNQYINKNKNKISELDKDETAMAKINSELDLLKKDLSNEVDVIIQNCYDNKIELIKEENQNNTSSSFVNNKNDLTTKNLNKSSSMQRFDFNNNSKKMNPVKNIGRSQSSLFKPASTNSNYNYLNNLSRKKSIDNFDMNKPNKNNLSIFTKFRILKSNKPLKLGSIGSSSSENQMRNISMFVTKEVIDFGKRSAEEEQLDKEIKKIDQNDYQQLIDLKGNYVDINDRLIWDIKEKKKICFNRIKQLNACVENNLIKLNKIKEANEIMKKELDAFEQKIMNKKNKKLNIKKEEEKINNEEKKENEEENKIENKEENKDENNENKNEIEENKSSKESKEKENINRKENEKTKENVNENEKLKEKRRRKKK